MRLVEEVGPSLHHGRALLQHVTPAIGCIRGHGDRKQRHLGEVAIRLHAQSGDLVPALPVCGLTLPLVDQLSRLEAFGLVAWLGAT